MNKDFQTLRKSLVSGALLLSMMLTGCSDDKDNSKKVYVDNTYNYTEIVYAEDGSITGTLPSDKVDEYVKIITFKQGDVTFTRLVGVEDHRDGAVRGPHYRIVKYSDLDTGVTLISYINHDTSGETMDHVGYSIGENLEIVEVKDFMPYLYQEGKFADEYEINDLLNFYHEKVEPTLEDNDEIILG